MPLAPRRRSGNHIYYGVREFGMSRHLERHRAARRLHCRIAATFLTFSDYARNALRMAALMKQRVIFVFTHDSIGLGEDGPTHQPVEHAATLRLIPQHGRLAPVRRRRNRWSHGSPRSSEAMGRAACSSRARTCRSQQRDGGAAR